ncbi:26S proteasome non-ATPase regulatory subunit 4-like [Amphiura filiformis]|uniref:26S proteasome non-ATPase regulatory subunit 4-like n=1 Tax=Amphiura filiformis TaxID=82378 RepID=UPI003B227B5A
MVLESTVVCVDTSEFMRNGDFIPTRIQAQQDAVNLVCMSKTRSNPENNVGLIALTNAKVLNTLTTDAGRILATLHQVQPNGEMNFMTGIKVAHLSLKHRQGKNHRMRIIAFVGSPIDHDEKDLVKLAKKLKKEKVNVDIVNFGEENANTEKLTTFINTINGSEGTSSHLVTIPPGTMLSDALRQSPIIVGEDGSGAMPGLPGSGGEFDFGFDPSSDPELAMALRISMEEQRQRQEEGTRKEGDAPAGESEAQKPVAQPTDSDEAMLEQALAMSMQPASSASQEAPMPDFSAMTEEEQIAYAMQMSLQADEEAAAAAATAEGAKETPMETDTPAAEGTETKAAEGEDFSEVMSDPAFLQSVLQNLPGVDPSSEAIRNVLDTLPQQTEEQKKDEKKKKDEEKK